MTKNQKFEVFVSDYSSSVDEWKQAMAAPVSELPKLNDQQKEVAKKFGVSEEEYGRGVLSGQLGEVRMRRRGQGLGEVVQGLLDGLGPGYRLIAVKAEMFNGRWLIRIETPDKVANIALPRELADDVLDSGTMEEMEKLKVRLLAGLGRNELIMRR